MNVWVVSDHKGFTGGFVVGVFGDKAAAVRWMERNAPKQGRLVIERFRVRGGKD